MCVVASRTGCIGNLYNFNEKKIKTIAISMVKTVLMQSYEDHTLLSI